MNQDIRDFVIIGVTHAGRRFRPSDWSDRLCSTMSAFGTDRRMQYSPYVQPGNSEEGHKTVNVKARLYDLEPMAYNFLVRFAHDNDLVLRYAGDPPPEQT